VVEDGRARRLHVAVEGFCPDLRIAVLGTEAFAHRDDGAVLRLTSARLAALPRIPPVRDRHGNPARALEDLHGRWPDRLFASVVTPEGSGIANGLMHYDGHDWKPTPGLTDVNAIREVDLWNHDRLVVRVLAHDNDGLFDDLRVLVPEDSQLDMARRLSVCGRETGFSHVTIDRTGVMGIALSCPDAQHLAIWRFEDDAPVIHRLDLATSVGSPFAVASDTRGGFVAAYRESILVHFEPRGVRVLDVPGRGARVTFMDVDSKGRIWILRGDALYRQATSGWVRERVPGLGVIEQVGSIASKTPWIRRRGTFYLHGWQLREDGRILARDGHGEWQSVPPPRSRVFPGEPLYVDFFFPTADGNMWTQAHSRRRHGPAGREIPWLAILSTAEFAEPIMCSDARARSYLGEDPPRL